MSTDRARAEDDEPVTVVEAHDTPAPCRATDPSTWPADEREWALREGWIGAAR